MENGIQFEAIKKFLVDYWNYLKKFRYLFLVFALIGLSLGVFYAYRYKPYYMASLSFILNDAKSSSGGALSALAGQLGLSTGSPTITDDRVLYLGRTKRILGQAMLKRMEHTDITIADKLAEVFKLKNGWASDTTLFDLDRIRARNLSDLTYKENKAIDQLVTFILKSNRFGIESVSRKSTSFVGVQNSGIIQLNFESRDEQVSIQFIQAIYDELSMFYVNTMTKNLQSTYDLIAFKTDSLRNRLLELEDATASSSDQAMTMFRYSGKLSEQRMRRELNILSALYAESTKNKELAKFNLEQDRPVFQLVDTPMAPLETKGKSMFTFGFLGMFGFCCLAVGALSVWYLFQLVRKSESAARL